MLSYLLKTLPAPMILAMNWWGSLKVPHSLMILLAEAVIAIIVNVNGKYIVAAVRKQHRAQHHLSLL